MKMGSIGNEAIAGERVSGLSGDDSLSSTGSRVVLSGGLGDDTLRANYNALGQLFDPNPMWELDGGDGSDDLILAVDINGTKVSAPSDYLSELVINGGSGDEAIDIVQVVDLSQLGLFPSVQSNILITDNGGNNFIGVTNDLTSGDNSVGATINLQLGTGSDTVVIQNTGEGDNYAAVFNDKIHLGGGNDRLSVTSKLGFANSQIYAGGGNDTLYAVFHVDEANENFSSLQLLQEAGSGNDSVSVEVNDPSGSGTGTIAGSFVLGRGDDTLRLSTDNAPTSLLIDGGRGDNDLVLEFVRPTSGTYADEGHLTVSTLGGADRLVVDGPGAASIPPFVLSANTGFGNDTILTSGLSAVEIDAGSNDDRIQILTIANSSSNSGDTLTNSVAGGHGSDNITIVDNTLPSNGFRLQLVDGGSGDDSVFSRLDGDGRQIVDGGAGADSLVVRAGENNSIHGGYGDDTIDASSNGDTISGDGGADVINGRGGNDLLSGGAGADRYIFNVLTNFGDDTISDWNAVVDVLDFNVDESGATGLADDIDKLSTLIQVGPDAILQFDDTGASITFLGFGSAITSVADLVGDPMDQLV